jgi:arsenite methyltransferase
MAVCEKTFRIYTREPYASQIIPVEPYIDIPLEEAEEFDCRRSALRHPKETKGEDYNITDLSGASCEGESCC